MELSELVKEIGTHGVDDVVKALQSNAHGIWQEIWNLGHANKTAAVKTDLETKETELTTAKAATSKLEGQLEQLRSSQPDTAKVREQYDTEIKELNDKHDKVVADLKTSRATSEVDREIATFQSRLVAAGADPDYAEVLAQKSSNRERFRHEENGVQILQAGKDIPIAAGDGKTALDVMVDEVISTIPARFVNSKADKGTGQRTNQQGAGGGSGTVYDRIREERKTEREKSAGGSDHLQPRDILAARTNRSP